MSADSSIVFFGHRIELAENDLEACEARTHPLQIAARRVGLNCYWDDFGGSGDRYLLFIGKTLGMLGIEGSSEVRLDRDDLLRIMTETSQKLVLAGIGEIPALFLQYQPDV